MQRRKLILDSIKAIPLLLLSPSLLASCGKEEQPFDANGKTVVVIGAGISGLSAAKILKQKGFTVTVLEAQEKIGGRTRTDRSLGIPFDEGASWIHGPKGNPITNLASQSGANTFMTNEYNLEVYDKDGTAYSNAYLLEQYTQFENAINAVSGIGTKDQSFETVFNSLFPGKLNNRLWKYMLSAYLEFDTGGDISNLSSKYFYDDEEFSGKDVIITNGYDKISDYLGEGLDIRLNTRVSEIDYSGTKTIVSAGSNTFEADYAIVSVPLGVLKNNALSFSPNLPQSKTAAIQNTQMGNVNKFLLLWNASFWDTDVQYIGYSPETKGKFNFFLNMKKFLPATNGLMTFAYGDYANETEIMSDTEISNEIMVHLKSIYGGGIPEPTHFLRTKWGQNINSFGAYSFATNGTTTKDFDHMAEAVNNKLFFAGEHTNRFYRATVHGAYLSGLRAAQEIIELQ